MEARPTSLGQLQDSQKVVDERSFQLGDYSFDQLGLAQIVRHDLFHLVKLTGKIAQFCHELDHGFSPSTDQLAEEVVPDLLIYALQISNALGVDLDELYQKRIRDVEPKLRRDASEDVG